MRPLEASRLVPRAKLRVAYFVKRFPRLSETFVVNEILELERSGVAVEVFSLLTPETEPRHDDLLSRLKAQVHYLDRGSAKGKVPNVACPRDDLLTGKSPDAAAVIWSKAGTAADIIKRAECQHLHAHFGNDAATVAIMAGRLSGLPVSFTAHAKDIYHTYVSDRADALLRRTKISAADFVVTVTECNKHHLMSLAGPSAGDKIERVYNGIDTDRFSFHGSMGRKPDRVLAVGRLVEKKGYPDLIDAVRIARLTNPNLRAVICGEGPLRPRLEQQISERGLEDCVELIGSVDQRRIVEHMRAASVLALPSVITQSGDRDALPTVIIEAQASGLPVVATAVSGIPEMIEHERTGLLVPERDPDALAAAINRALRSGEAADWTKAARKNVEKKFDLQKNVQALRDMFEASATSQVRRGQGGAVRRPDWQQSRKVMFLNSSPD